MIQAKAPKPKRCKECKEFFTPKSSTQIVCHWGCALALAASQKAKAEKDAKIKDKKETRAKLVKMKSNAKLAAEAQTMVNKYVRLRDKHLGCVSCDRPASWKGQWHASHFRSVGAASGLRFHLWNVHKACSVCNNWKSGNLSEYAPRLADRIGRDKVDWLRTQNAVKHTDAAYLVRLKKVFAKKVRRLEARLA